MMNLVKTKSFEIAVNSSGDKNSSKVAILLPGRLDTKDYANFDSHLDYLAHLGFYAVALDPPGTWDSPGGIELFTTTNYLAAVNELIEYLGNKPTLLFGHSRGGAVANIIGTTNPAVVCIITAMASFGAPTPPDHETIKAGVYLDHRDFPPGTEKNPRQKIFAVPLSYFTDGGKYNDAEVLKSCLKPKLVFYGANDEFSSPKRVKKIFATLPDPKELHWLKCTHDYRYFPQIINEVNQATKIFLEQYFSTSYEK